MTQSPKIFCILILLLFIYGCQNTAELHNNKEKLIRIGLQAGPASTLLYVAKDAGFFQKEGLNVELVDFTAGKFALQALLDGSLDLAGSGEVPVMYAALQGNEFYILTQVVERTLNEVRVIARKEANLNTPQDYFKAKKRKLATSFGGGPEFYTYTFLKKYGITDVEVISQKPEDMPAALESGSVDAIAIFDPFAFFAEAQLGIKGITFKDDALYSELYVLSAKKEWVNANPALAEDLIRALMKASNYVQAHPEEAKKILMEHTKLDKATINGIWNNFVYKPVLSELLLTYLTAEAQWAQETGKMDRTISIPDFRTYLYKKPLEKIYST